MRVALIVALAFGIAAACAPTPTPVAPAAPTTAQAQADPDASACAARGGQIVPICRMQRPTCVIRYADAGRACRGDADCEGRCYAKGDAREGEPVVGRCQASSNPCGCHTLVENGRADATMCVD